MKIKISEETPVPGTYKEYDDISKESLDENVMVNFRYSDEDLPSPADEEDTNIEETESPTLLIIRTCFVTLFRNCLQQFQILRRMCAPLAEPLVVKHINYETVHQRFSDSTSNYGDLKIDNAYTDAHKFQKDLGFIIFLLETLIDEAYKWGTFTMFSQNMDVLLQLKQDEDDLIKQMQEKRVLLNQIRRAVVCERQTEIATERNYNEALTERVKFYQDALARATSEMQYIKNWEDSRYEQNVMRIEKKENFYKDSAFEMQWKIELEESCHQQFEDFIVLSKRECMNEIQHWMEQYDSELDKKDIQIYDKRTEIDKLKEHHELMKVEYETRTQNMEDWLEYKRKRQEAEELEAAQLKAAIKIQAWWRGVMFRRKLGPYRKKKKGKKDQGKTKKTPKSKRSDR